MTGANKACATRKGIDANDEHLLTYSIVMADDATLHRLLTSYHLSVPRRLGSHTIV